MRWKEEVTLTGYEMQWTIRFFSFMSKKWILPTVVSPPLGRGSLLSDTGPDPRIPNLSIGAIAYWKRKRATWDGLVKKADTIFKRSHPAYESPL